MSGKYVTTKRANTTRNAFHLDPECVRLKKSNVRPTTEHEIKYFGITSCPYCDPEKEIPNNKTEQDMSYQRALKEAAKE